jgi:transcription termination/antitermination protein NusG
MSEKLTSIIETDIETGPIKEAKWYVVHTLANKEGMTKKYLERHIQKEEMQDYIFEILVPTEMVTEIKAGKKSLKSRKFYPGYLFIHMRLYDDDGQLLQKTWHFVRNCNGVLGFIGGDNPTPLKEDEIQEIFNQVKEAEGKEVPKVRFNIGEEVKIVDGPFINLTGTIDEIDFERGKLKISVSIFGRFTPVELEFWQVGHEKNS